MIKDLSVLIIDDEYGNSEQLKNDFARITGIEAKTYIQKFDSGQDSQGKNSFPKVLDLVKSRDWSLILLDLNFKSSSKSNLDFGAQVYLELKEIDPALPVVMLTGEDAANLPTSLPDDVPYLSKEALGLIGDERRKFAEANQAEQERLSWQNWRNLVMYGFFQGKGPAAARHLTINQKRELLCMSEQEIATTDTMLQVFYELFRRADPFDNKNLLLLGESGTGKQVMAEYYYRLTQISSIKAGRGVKPAPFVCQEITAVTNTIFESLLFGRKKGVSADARTDEPGLVDAAGDGVLFLDEIGDLDVESQNKLRRLLENRKYRWVGETAERHARCRFVFATNRDISDSSIFKSDLYRRMGTPVTIPPLREHTEDIIPLTRYFAAGRVSIASSALERLSNCNFSFNIRELRNMVLDISGQKPLRGKITVADIDAWLIQYSESGNKNRHPVSEDAASDSEVVNTAKLAKLGDISRLLDSIDVDKNNPALEGGVLEIEAAYCRLLQRMHTASLRRFNGNNRAAMLYMLGLQDGSAINTLYSRARRAIEKNELKYFAEKRSKASLKDAAQADA